jgi:hypothetical protein
MTRLQTYSGEREASLDLVMNGESILVGVCEVEGPAADDRIVATIRLSQDEAARLATDLTDWLGGPRP